MKMKIIIAPQLYHLLNQLSEEYEDFEIAGFLCGRVKDKKIYLTDLIIPRQTVSKAHVNISPESLSEMRLKYGDKCTHILGIWHSHNDMGEFWSNIDENAITNYIRTKPFYVFGVSSCGKHLFKIVINSPLDVVFDEDDVELKVWSKKIELIKKKVSNIIEKNKEEVPPEEREGYNGQHIMTGSEYDEWTKDE